MSIIIEATASRIGPTLMSAERAPCSAQRVVLALRTRQCAFQVAIGRPLAVVQAG
jgi:hypothetical protein